MAIIQLIVGAGAFCALYNIIECEHTVELVLKPLCCGKKIPQVMLLESILQSKTLLHLD